MTNHEKHILLWDELAKMGVSLNVKDDVFARLFPDCDKDSDAACNSCWACQEDEELRGDGPTCRHCPIDWGEKQCSDEGTLFNAWSTSEDPEQRKLLASQIRDLPWRTK